ncbi:MAG: ELWxxDGT repeat protein, partial [Saprospiraceae bacterium]
MKFLMKLFSLLLAGLFPFWLCAQLPNVGLVVDLNSGTNSGGASNFMKLGSTMIYSASDGSTGVELWKTDGTAAGTVFIKDIRPGTSSSGIGNMRLMGSFVYFTANDGTNGGALWRTDGTTAGTTMVKDLNASTNSSSNITELTVVGNRLYFRGDDGVNGTEPWISDGSTNGTVMLKNIAPGSGSSSGFNCISCFGTYEFVEFGGFVYFNANDLSNSGQQNSELWRTDGTTGGTVLFKDNYSLAGGGPANLVNAGSFLFFTSDNQGNTGSEPWKTDGTVGGTVMIKDVFNPGFNQGSILGDVPTIYMNGFVYFVAVDSYVPGNFNLNPP